MTDGIRGISNGVFGSVGNGFGFFKKDTTEEPVQEAAPEITTDFKKPEDVLAFMNNGVNAFVPRQSILPVELSPETITRIEESITQYMNVREIVKTELGLNNEDIVNLVMENFPA